jgi:hypothetical protein
MGPVTQKHEVEANIKQTTIPPEAIAIIEEDIEKKLTDES